MLDFEEQIYKLTHPNEENTFDSEEDTEEASEGEPWGNEPLEIREQMYQDKLLNLKQQLTDLKMGAHSELLKRIRKLDTQCKERIRLNEIYRDYLVSCVEKDYILEKNAAVKEYEEKKADLRDNLLTDFEDKRKAIENEHQIMELNNDSSECKPTITRKLRRRPNEPVPNVASEKRRKNSPGQLILQLDDKEIDNDLKLISKGKILTPTKQNNYCSALNGSAVLVNIGASRGETSQYETKIEDGKLLYDRRWYHRGQPIFVEGKDFSRFSATISAIGNETIWVKKTSDNSKFRIFISQLSRGKINIKRRAN